MRPAAQFVAPDVVPTRSRRAKMKLRRQTGRREISQTERRQPEIADVGSARQNETNVSANRHVDLATGRQLLLTRQVRRTPCRVLCDQPHVHGVDADISGSAASRNGGKQGAARDKCAIRVQWQWPERANAVPS